MKKRLITISALVALSGIIWYVNAIYQNNYLTKIFYSSAIILAFYILFRVIIEPVMLKQVTEDNLRFSLKKVIYVTYWVLMLIFVAGTWIEDAKSILVAYGIIGAGIAIALQDIFKNLAGSILIISNNMFKIGDRVEINGVVGDVIDMNVLNTTVMEIRGWVGGDQVTGRLVIIPNGFVLNSNIINYSKDHDFIWDEINIPITYGSDWHEANKTFMRILEEETLENSAKAEKEISKLKEKYYLERKATKPAIFISLTDNWVEFKMRYVVDIKNRRVIHNKISQRILEEIQKSHKIEIASSTLEIVKFPKN